MFFNFDKYKEKFYVKIKYVYTKLNTPLKFLNLLSFIDKIKMNLENLINMHIIYIRKIEKIFSFSISFLIILCLISSIVYYYNNNNNNIDNFNKANYCYRFYDLKNKYLYTLCNEKDSLNKYFFKSKTLENYFVKKIKNVDLSTLFVLKDINYDVYFNERTNQNYIYFKRKVELKEEYIYGINDKNEVRLYLLIKNKTQNKEYEYMIKVENKKEIEKFNIGNINYVRTLYERKIHYKK